MSKAISSSAKLSWREPGWTSGECLFLAQSVVSRCPLPRQLLEEKRTWLGQGEAATLLTYTCQSVDEFAAMRSACIGPHKKACCGGGVSLKHYRAPCQPESQLIQITGAWLARNHFPHTCMKEWHHSSFIAQH